MFLNVRYQGTKVGQKQFLILTKDTGVLFALIDRTPKKSFGHPDWSECITNYVLVINFVSTSYYLIKRKTSLK